MLLKKASGIIPGALILHNQRMVLVFKDKTNAVRHALERQDTLEIKGTQNEDNSITEGSIVFDVLFRAKAPVTHEIITLIINVEAQKHLKPKKNWWYLSSIKKSCLLCQPIDFFTKRDRIHQ